MKLVRNSSGSDAVTLCASSDLSTMIMIFLLYGGPLGVIIYTICSSWFLVDDEKVKLEKVTSFLYPEPYRLCGFWQAWGDREKLDIKFIIKQCLPFLFRTKWFLNAYIILYVLHPIFNLVIKGISKRKYMLFLLVASISICGITFTNPDCLFYTQLTAMIWLYFLIGYLKTHCKGFCRKPSMNRKVLCLGTGVFLVRGAVLMVSYCLSAVYTAIFQRMIDKLAAIITRKVSLLEAMLWGIIKDER